MSMLNVKTKSRYLQNKNYEEEIIKSRNKFTGKSHITDYVICSICGFYGKDLSSHIPRTHHVSNNEYKEKYKIAIKCDSVKNMMSQRISGKNNPGYQHNGKFSALSKNFIHYTEDSIKNTSKKISKSNKENGNNNSTLAYWLKYTNGDGTKAKELLSQRQKTFSLEVCIEKYGEEKGLEVFNARQEKWLATLDSKTDEEKLRINKAKLYKNGMISNSEKSLYKLLLNYFPELESQYIINYSSTKNYVYDIKHNNKIIEFNGNYWHADPAKYKENQCIRFPGRDSVLVEDIWEKDRLKLEYAKELGFEVLVIWESEYLNKPEEIVQKCITFLTQ
jgi:hypothetical protein